MLPDEGDLVPPFDSTVAQDAKDATLAPPPPGESSVFEVGETLSQTYTIRSVLGQGGMGDVYEAYDFVLRRAVAIKTCRHAGLLVREAVALSAVGHPSLPTVHHLGVERGIQYMVFECVRGVDLGKHVRNRSAQNDPLAIREVLDILVAVADALAIIHRAGIVHRDIKPDNVLLTPDGRTVLLDFGVFAPMNEPVTTCVGTAAYMAPEALRGTVDPALLHLVDVYALGALAYELLAGVPPHDGPTPSHVLRRQITSPVPDVTEHRTDVPPRLAALVSAMLEHDPQNRPQTAALVGLQLRALRAPRREEGPFTVLIVDDDVNVGRVLEMLVKRAVPDAEIRIARSGEAGSAMVKQQPPELMLLDLHMPGMNGIELYSFLRGSQLVERCTIVFVSAAADEEDLALLYRLGVAHFVPKGEHLSRRLVPLIQEIHASR